MISKKETTFKKLFQVNLSNEKISCWFKIYQSLFTESEIPGYSEIAISVCKAKGEEMIKILRKGK